MAATCLRTGRGVVLCSTLNKAVPAPLDEKSMYSLYVFGTLMKANRKVVDFYKELRDEVKDRVARGIAAVGNEQCRLMSDTQPPWAFLKVFRYLERYGAVSVGSLYTFGLEGIWEVKEDGSWGPRTTPMEGFPVMTFEGNMGDEREFDEVSTMARIDTFMESMGVKKLY